MHVPNTATAHYLPAKEAASRLNCCTYKRCALVSGQLGPRAYSSAAKVASASKPAARTTGAHTRPAPPHTLHERTIIAG